MDQRKEEEIGFALAVESLSEHLHTVLQAWKGHCKDEHYNTLLNSMEILDSLTEETKEGSHGD